MQKKLLSLAAVIIMVGISNLSYGEEKVPVISEAQNEENKKKYQELGADINKLKEQAHEKEIEKDEIEKALHSYKKRNEFRQKLVVGLSGSKEAIKNHKVTSDSQADDDDADMKKRDNGITTTMLGYLTEPLADSASGKAYARIKKRTDNAKKINAGLSREFIEYMQVVEKEVLPELNDTLNGKHDTMVNLIRSFRQCDRYQDNDYDACLDNEGITMIQRSEAFPDRFIRNAYRAAYEDAIARNVPITEEEIIGIALRNGITKDSAIKANAKKEELKKAILREQRVQEHGEEKDTSSILDPKEDQNDQGSLSQ